MNSMKRYLLLSLLTIFAAACSTSALITDDARRARVQERLEQRASWLPQIPQDATPEERDALSFIYAYMPASDAADYTAELFMTNVRASLTARKEMAWNIPENLFLHFVLPIRINNETLDTSRIDFYAELRDRVHGLSMQDAILEVNHWCHEKVVYTPSDSRTSAPSASVRSAYGRCGEESTLTVAALRAVGIPARQVYTPRWAHTDDNHAWVEAWADGKWYYTGACEPEPVLNTGWFDAPAARGMLMHSKVFGEYEGEEQNISHTECYTEINVTQNYAPVARARVRVVTPDGRSVAGAKVDFGIYNYAEFYPAARRTADEQGETELTAGLGTMVVWATDGRNYGFTELAFGQMDSIEITLNNPAGRIALDIIPPVERSVSRDITPEARARNNVRLAQEDSIRKIYTDTFATEAQARKLALDIGTDAAIVWKYLSASRGNHDQISQFLRQTPAENLDIALSLLGVISAKDLRDTPASVLTDHCSGAAKYRNEPFFTEYILNPRINNELLTPYRTRLAEIGACGTATDILASMGPITEITTENPAELAITPLGVYNLRMADHAARERYTIALLRSKGIAARHEPITENLQYFDKQNKTWVNINTLRNVERGTLKLSYKPTKANANPKYEIHFTLARGVNGEWQTLDLSSALATVDMGGDGISLDDLSREPLSLEQGTYRLLTGTRLANGTVLAEMTFFDIAPARETSIEIRMREDEQSVQVIGSINPEQTYIDATTGQSKSILATTGRGYFVVAILGAKQEPTNHALRDLALLNERFEKWGRTMVMIFADEQGYKKFDRSEFKNLPTNIAWGYDTPQNDMAKMLVSSLKLPSISNLPIFVIADTFGRVVFVSQGYKIGLGEQMIRIIDKL